MIPRNTRNARNILALFVLARVMFCDARGTAQRSKRTPKGMVARDMGVRVGDVEGLCERKPQCRDVTSRALIYCGLHDTWVGEKLLSAATVNDSRTDSPKSHVAGTASQDFGRNASAVSEAKP
ncbi:MAG: hypothetical protein AAF468_12465 [Pseudomonadota bacterium]